MINKYTVTCDKCSTCINLGDMPFRKKIEHIRKLGWLIKKTGAHYHKWRHECTDCRPVKNKEVTESINWWAKYDGY